MTHAIAPLGVVDYGVNNVGSVLSMLRKIGVEAEAVRTPAALAGKRAIVLPGIGAFDAGVTNLKELGLFDAIRQRVLEERTPILGICLGMQLLADGSEEGKLGGLGLVPGKARRFVFERTPHASLKVPHMGWNRAQCVERELFTGLDEPTAADPRPKFYFVHSYHVVCEDPAHVAAQATYGVPFTAAIRRGHVMGTQFHPEKSHRYGMKVLENFARIVESHA